MPTAEINGTRLHYQTHGGRGPRLMLIMGLRARGVAFQPLVERLAADHQLAWFDHRGIGESAPIARSTDMREMAADAVGLMDHLGWERSHVVGVSMGGMVAQHVALNHTPRTQSLSLLVTTPHGRATLRPSAGTLWLYLQTLRGTRTQRLGALTRILYGDEFIAREGTEALVERLLLAFGHDQPGTWRAQVSAIAGHDVRARLPSVSHLPSLIVGAGGDRLVPIAHSEALHRLLPRARFERFERAGHGVLAEEADAVARLVREHVGAAELHRGS